MTACPIGGGCGTDRPRRGHPRRGHRRYPRALRERHHVKATFRALEAASRARTGRPRPDRAPGEWDAIFANARNRALASLREGGDHASIEG